MAAPRVVLLTANERRHRYLASLLAETLPLAGIVCEAKRAVGGGAAPPADPLTQAHLMERDAAERRYFGEAAFPVGPERILNVGLGESNSPQAHEWVSALNPDAVVLYGTSIIKPPLLTAFGDNMINLHLGLSPYYRGAGTNFWPLVNGEPECVGATVHLAVARVDAGAILGQVRPQPQPSDRCHDLGCKTISAGGRLLARCVADYVGGGLKPTPQARGGRLYRGGDFNAAAVRRLWDNLAADMMPRYVANRAARDLAYPIVER